MYSTYNEERSVVAQRFIRILNNKIQKYTTSLSKNLYIDKLDDIFNKCSNTYHSTIRMNPIDVNSSTYIDFDIENNVKDPKFKVGGHARISKYKGIFAKDYENVFVIKNVENTVPWIYVISDLNGEELVGTFQEKELKKKNQTEFTTEKVIKRKVDKWKDYDNYDNSWIDKKDIVIQNEFSS